MNVLSATTSRRPIKSRSYLFCYFPNYVTAKRPKLQNNKRHSSHVHLETPSPDQVSSRTRAVVRHTPPQWRTWLFLLQDRATAGIGAVTVAVFCMNPVDLLKVKFQVSTGGPEGGAWHYNWRGLYRRLGLDVAGNVGIYGLYFLLCVCSLSSLAFLEILACESAGTI